MWAHGARRGVGEREKEGGDKEKEEKEKERKDKKENKKEDKSRVGRGRGDCWNRAGLFERFQPGRSEAKSCLRLSPLRPPELPSYAPSLSCKHVCNATAVQSEGPVGARSVVQH